MLLLRQFQINKFHILLASEANILHECLQNDFRAGVASGQFSCYPSIENLWVLDTPGDVQKLDQRMQVLDGVDAKAKISGFESAELP